MLSNTVRLSLASASESPRPIPAWRSAAKSFHAQDKASDTSSSRSGEATPWLTTISTWRTAIPSRKEQQSWLVGCVSRDGNASVSLLEARNTAADVPELLWQAHIRIRGPWEQNGEKVVAIEWNPEPEARAHRRAQSFTGSYQELIVGVGDGKLWFVQICVADGPSTELSVSPEFMEELPLHVPGLTTLAATLEGCWIGGLLSAPQFIYWSNPERPTVFDSAWVGAPTSLCPLSIGADENTAENMNESPLSALWGFDNGQILLCTCDNGKPNVERITLKSGRTPPITAVKSIDYIPSQDFATCVFANGNVGSIDLSLKRMTAQHVLSNTEIVSAGLNFQETHNICLTKKGIFALPLARSEQRLEPVVSWKNVLDLVTVVYSSPTLENDEEILIYLTASELIAGHPSLPSWQDEGHPDSVSDALARLEKFAKQEKVLEDVSHNLDARLESLEQYGRLESESLQCNVHLHARQSFVNLSGQTHNQVGAKDATSGHLSIIVELQGPLLPDEWYLIVSVSQESELGTISSAPPSVVCSWPLQEISQTVHKESAANLQSKKYNAVASPFQMYSEMPVCAQVWLAAPAQGLSRLLVKQEWDVLTVCHLLRDSTDISNSHSRIDMLQRLCAPEPSLNLQVNDACMSLFLPMEAIEKFKHASLEWMGNAIEIRKDIDQPQTLRLRTANWPLCIAARHALLLRHMPTSLSENEYARFFRENIRRCDKAGKLCEDLLLRLDRDFDFLTPAASIDPKMISCALSECWEIYTTLRRGKDV